MPPPTDLLIQIKPKLSEGRKANDDTLMTQLYRLAGLAESITEQRPYSDSRWLSQADDLDREGQDTALPSPTHPPHSAPTFRIFCLNFFLLFVFRGYH